MLKNTSGRQGNSGYGHAVLRQTDPRFIVQMEFANKYVKDDPIINIVNNLYEIVPPILGNIAD